jgi:hypothetical protein
MGDDAAGVASDHRRLSSTRGPDFLKFGGTSHFSEPTFIGFSADAQRVIVEEAHKRNRAAETHSRRASKKDCACRLPPV